MRPLVYLFPVLILVSCQSALIGPSEVCTGDNTLAINADHPKSAVAQAIMDRYTSNGLPGISVLIDDEEGLWMGSAGYADLENQIPMQPCHINKLGSVAKMMMGTLAWQFIQEGKLSLDDPIAEHIPDAAARVTNGDVITVGMLLNHTAGVYDFARDLNLNLAVINDMDQVWTKEMLLDIIGEKDAVHEPGQDISYSNSHTFLLALILEAISGKPHGDLLQERLFTPLGMENTFRYDYSAPFPRENVAQGYLDFHNDGKSIQNISPLNPGNYGFTGVYSTVGDLYRFVNALLREKTLTTPENLELIFSGFRGKEGQSWRGSYGAIHDEFRPVLENLPGDVHAYGHAGGDIGYSATVNYFPHNNTILTVTYNYGTNLPTDLGGKLIDIRHELVLLAAE